MKAKFIFILLSSCYKEDENTFEVFIRRLRIKNWDQIKEDI
jgi:hypothetical protein